MNNQLQFKIASEHWELEQIHNLNYSTFVEEIPQHSPNTDKSLVDKFHDENTYVICIKGKEVLGMLAIRDKRPFSLDYKLDNLDFYLPPANCMCEIRLLTIKPERRNGRILEGLFTTLSEYAEKRGYDLALISGTLRQIKLYQHVGFTSFGPVVGTKDAPYQPMYLSLDAYIKFRNETRIFRKQRLAGGSNNFLPGPVAVSEKVRYSCSQAPLSHRSAKFIRDFNDTRKQLCRLVKADNVQILMGSGTLANDTVAAQLSLMNDRGLILVNGEFGLRLVDHARCAGLSFKVLQSAFGAAIDSDQIKQTVKDDPSIRWLWTVHCETSTGVLNDIDYLQDICGRAGMRLCLDCISSIGTVPVDLSKVYLASCVSGKGLGSLPGLAMVFYNHRIEPAGNCIPRILDLGYYEKKEGIPFTISSNLLYALSSALEQQDWELRFKDTASWVATVRHELLKSGIPLLSQEAHVSPAVITISLPDTISSLDLGQRLEDSGVMISYRSDYLIRNNWIQICRMGEVDQDTENMLKLLKKQWDMLNVESNNKKTEKVTTINRPESIGEMNLLSS